MIADIVRDVLLVIAVLSVAFACTGVLVMRDVYERLHYLAAPGTVGVVALAGAVFAEEGLGQAGLTVALVALVVLLSNAVLTHATARAARIRQFGGWVAEATPAERRGEDGS